MGNVPPEAAIWNTKKITPIALPTLFNSETSVYKIVKKTTL